MGRAARDHSLSYLAARGARCRRRRPDRKTQTGFSGYLRGAGIQRVLVCGLAPDYCVAWSALDAKKLGFRAAVIEDTCRGIDLNGSLEKAWADLKKAGVLRVQSSELE